MRRKQNPGVYPDTASCGRPNTPNRSGTDGIDQAAGNNPTSPACMSQHPAAGGDTDLTASLPGRPRLVTSARSRHVVEHKPPVDLVFSFAALYFRHIHPWIPFLDAQRIFSEMACKDDPPLLFYALFGISLRFSSDSRLTPDACDSFWKYAKRKIFVEVLEEPSYASLEALTVLVLDLSGMTHGPQVWGALAVAVKLAVQLKTNDGRVLRVSAGESDRRNIQPVVELSRRRLFWAIFTLDCYVSITTSQPSQLANNYISDFIPLRQATWSGDGVLDKNQAPSAVPSLAIFNYQLRLMVISRDIHASFLEYIEIDEINASQCECWLQKFKACSDNLEEWLNSCPEIQQAYENPGLWVKSSLVSSFATMYAYKNALTIYLHGMVAYPSSPRLGMQFAVYQAVSRQKCAQDIEKLVHVVTLLKKEHLDRFGWPFGWAIWVAARYILIAEHGEGSTIPVSHFATLLGCLEELAQYWKSNSKYWWLLRQGRSELDSNIVSESGVLRFMLDQHATTSDLEDRFRCDPFFSENDTTTSGYHEAWPPSSGASQHVPDISAPGGDNPDNDLMLQAMGFPVSSMSSELWCPGPLNPSFTFSTALSSIE